MITFTYSFPTTLIAGTTLTPSSGGYFLNGEFVTSNSTISQYSLTSALSDAFAMWSNVIDVNYIQGSSATNHLSVAYWNTAENGRGSGTTYGEGSNFNTATNFWIFLNKNFDVNDPNGPADYMITNPTFGNWGIWNLAHEIGHTLLGDGHPPVTSDLRFSIMAYPEFHALAGAISGAIINPPNDNIKIPLTAGKRHKLATCRLNIIVTN